MELKVGGDIAEQRAKVIKGMKGFKKPGQGPHSALPYRGADPMVKDEAIASKSVGHADPNKNKLSK